MADELRFEVLGPVRAWRGDAEIALGSPQQRSLLAFLLLQDGTAVTTAQLVAALWPDEPPPAAVGMVRSYVSRLRRALGPAVVASVAGGYAVRLDSPDDLDLTVFRRLLATARRSDGDPAATALRSALALWRGTPLAGVAADFAEFERVRLAELRLTALEDLAAADIDAGRPAEAAADLAELVAEEPLRERPRELLMLALYRSGRQADALAVFADVQHRLSEELGLYPGPGLQELQRRILTAEPVPPAPAAPTAPAAAPVEPQLTPSFTGSVQRPCQLPPDLPEFVGRHEELAVAAATLTPSSGTVPVLGVDGLARIGKTTFAVHLGRSLPMEFPDGHLFVDLGTSADPLAELLRGLGVRAGELPDSTGERATLWRTLSAGRRLLVVLDDARDGDQVRSLLPGAGGAAVVVTARQRLYGLAATRWLTLGVLPDGDALALFERLVGAERLRAEPDAVATLLTQAGGLPQVVQALGERIASRPDWTLRAAVERLHAPEPDAPVRAPECSSIEDPYDAMLIGLVPEQTRAFLLLAVPEVVEITPSFAAEVLGLPLGEAADLVESLVDVHLLTATGPDTYAYVAPLRRFARNRARESYGPGRPVRIVEAIA
ncbi:BTAD domain-containing putative transcriptional regulator [Jiangella mangrovi]|uniref:DNA-binding SARP family transcriptional activator n=1 Tax=Jiangella mangrovi TaxID=1524084 RepID=A0A7W9GML2_9ACTN|nr:DNA-binding SARP family transcriptional activator [Jiangella mangrovi]